MTSVLLLPFVVQLAIHLVNTFGKSTINEFVRPLRCALGTTCCCMANEERQLWKLFSALPTSTSHNASEATRLRREVVRLKREMAAVSAQDEFSRWAKLRRQHDKVAAEHEKLCTFPQLSRQAILLPGLRGLLVRRVSNRRT